MAYETRSPDRVAQKAAADAFVATCGLTGREAMATAGRIRDGKLRDGLDEKSIAFLEGLALALQEYGGKLLNP